MNDKVIVGDINSYIEDNIGYIILDNPNRLNAISLSMWENRILSRTYVSHPLGWDRNVDPTR